MCKFLQKVSFAALYALTDKPLLSTHRTYICAEVQSNGLIFIRSVEAKPIKFLVGMVEEIAKKSGSSSDLTVARIQGTDEAMYSHVMARHEDNHYNVIVWNFGDQLYITPEGLPIPSWSAKWTKSESDRYLKTAIQKLNQINKV